MYQEVRTVPYIDFNNYIRGSSFRLSLGIDILIYFIINLLMMFMDKKATLLIYKIVAVCTLTFTLFNFIASTVETKTMEDIKIFQEIETIEPCGDEYILYFSLAVMLGAFVNVKGLIKLGVI
jgi:hypothetical protein